MPIVDELLTKINAKLGKLIPEEAKPKKLSSLTSNESYLSTGLVSLNIKLGGGWPVGKVSLLWGVTKAGKSTLALRAVQATLDAGGIVIIADTEYALTEYMANMAGINTDQVVLFQPYHMEHAFMTFRETIRTAREMCPTVPILCVWDSYAATPTEGSIEREEAGEGATVSAEAKVFEDKYKAMLPVIYHNKATMLIITQARQNFEARKTGMAKVYRPKGPEALLHLPSAIMAMRRPDISVKDGKLVTTLRPRVEKTKFGHPMIEMEFQFTSDGIDETGEILRCLVDAGIVTKAGAWYQASEKLRWHGTPGFQAWVQEDPNRPAIVQRWALEGGVDETAL